MTRSVTRGSRSSRMREDITQCQPPSDRSSVLTGSP
ncbi:rCG44585 [Rattus norvegicus]|uniref:RCG44585 n=1 Tax=Rattus norvegicus TaxID=10116 RepID=A6I5N0_RAT|nr:rCG44585 [Rattus norvegicus]